MANGLSKRSFYLAEYDMEISEYERAGWIDAQLMFATETRMMYSRRGSLLSRPVTADLGLVSRLTGGGRRFSVSLVSNLLPPQPAVARTAIIIIITPYGTVHTL